MLSDVPRGGEESRGCRMTAICALPWLIAMVLLFLDAAWPGSCR